MIGNALCFFAGAFFGVIMSVFIINSMSMNGREDDFDEECK